MDFSGLKINRTFLIIALFLFSCKAEKYDQATRSFQNYLENKFNTEIGEERHFYFIVPRLSCAGCRKNVYDFREEISKMKNATLIMSGRALQADLMLEKTIGLPNMKVDSLDRISRVNLGVSNTMIIVTEKGKIKDLMEIKGRTDVRELLKKNNYHPKLKNQ